MIELDTAGIALTRRGRVVYVEDTWARLTAVIPRTVAHLAARLYVDVPDGRVDRILVPPAGIVALDGTSRGPVVRVRLEAVWNPDLELAAAPGSLFFLRPRRDMVAAARRIRHEVTALASRLAAMEPPRRLGALTLGPSPRIVPVR